MTMMLSVPVGKGSV